MASNFRTFTISQARMGEPLQFQPALGSKELDALVDAYVPGTASKSDKLSTVTLDFFTNATVDFTTGSLSRSYSVVVSPISNFSSFAFENSPTQSQSSGFSPPIFTPSPTSSMTFADSGYGSISMTPPMRSNGVSAGRVAKKPKKDTKMTAEARLPGFSIMTKDGIDVTSSAGRGTKTKEQREHAHLMRIMKACDACKRKKIRCDPSHRRSQTDMSRSSTSSTSSSRPNPSPPASVPPPISSYSNSAIDDFVLFPEDNTWNPTDMALPEFDDNLDLSQFNFEVSGFHEFAPVPNNYSPFDQQPASGFQMDRSLDHNPYVTDQYGLDQWASAQGGEFPVSHMRPQYSISLEDSGQLESSWSSGLQSTESPGSQATNSFTENIWNGGSATPQGSQLSVSPPEVDWSLLKSGMNAMSPAGDVSVPSSMNRRERRSLPRVERLRNAAIQELVDRIPSTSSESQPFGSFVGLNSPSDSSTPQSLSSFDRSNSDTQSSRNSPTESWYNHSQSQSPGAAKGGSLEYWGLDSTRALVTESMQALKSSGAAYQPLFEELQRLQGVLASVKSGDTERTPVLQQTLVTEVEMLVSQLQMLLTRVKNMLRSTRGSMQQHNRFDPEYHFDHLRELSAQTKRVVNSLCATINNLQTQDTYTGGTIAATNSSIIASGNLQLTVSPSSAPQGHPPDGGVYVPEASSSSISSGSLSYFRDVTPIDFQDDKTLEGEKSYQHELPSNGEALVSGSLAVSTMARVSRYRLVSKPAIERLSSRVDWPSDPTVLSDIDAIQSSPTTTFDQVLSSSSLLLRNARPGTASTHEVQNIVLSETDQTLRSNITILTSQAYQLRRLTPPTQQPLVSTAQNVGSSGSLPLCQGGQSSPGAIPGTVLEQYTSSGTARKNTTLFDGFATALVMLSSLALLNYIGATSFVLPLAALFLATPRPAYALITMATSIVVMTRAFPISNLMASLQALVTLAVLSGPQVRTSNIGTKGSFGESLSSSKSSLSSSLPSAKNSSLQLLFSDHSLGIPTV